MSRMMRVVALVLSILIGVILIAGLIKLLRPRPPATTTVPKLHVNVNAQAYEGLKDLLILGDTVGAVASRDKNTQFNKNKFDLAVEILNRIDKNEVGVQKIIVFSSLEDVRNLIDEVPADVGWISFNMELGLTPETELGKKEAVVEFAKIVHDSGRKAAWAPTQRILKELDRSGELQQVLQAIDAVGIQHQWVMHYCGLHGEKQGEECVRYGWTDEDGNPIGFVEETEKKVEQLKGYAPNVKVNVQLARGRNTVEEIIEGFKSVEDVIDTAVIFTTRDEEGIRFTRQVLEGLRTPP